MNFAGKLVDSFKQKRDAMRKYRYFGTPDNEDHVKKGLHLARHAALAGLVLGFWNSYVIKRAPTLELRLFNMARVAVPVTMLGPVYQGFLCMSQTLRNSDKPSDIVFACIATGAVIAIYTRKPVFLAIGAYISPFAAEQKRLRDTNDPMYGRIDPEYCYDELPFEFPNLTVTKDAPEYKGRLDWTPNF